jgi:antitoxin YefM
MIGNTMNILSFTDARAGLKAVMDDVCADHKPAIITRQNGEPVVMISLADYTSIEETLYLLGSAKNAQRLMKSVEQLKSGKSKIRKLIRNEQQEVQE